MHYLSFKLVFCWVDLAPEILGSPWEGTESGLRVQGAALLENLPPCLPTVSAASHHVVFSLVMLINMLLTCLSQLFVPAKSSLSVRRDFPFRL
jgi:hypothetical protein